MFDIGDNFSSLVFVYSLLFHGKKKNYIRIIKDINLPFKVFCKFISKKKKIYGIC